MTSSTLTNVSINDREAFYAAAVVGLRTLDQREQSPRRFGRDADMRWAAFKGALTDADRLDFLLRDAAVTWGAAFSPADAFSLFGLAPDDPFGPDWRPISGAAARRHIDTEYVVSSPAEVGTLLGVATEQLEVPSLDASTRLVVSGGAALVAVAQAFVAKPELSWSDQVLAVAVKPAHRQLAGLLAVFTNAQAQTRLCRPASDLREVMKNTGFTQIDLAVVSKDADAECTDFAHRVVGVA